MRILILILSAIPLFAASGSWNGVAFTAWNGIAQTSWNGTGISCAGGGGVTFPIVDDFNRANVNPISNPTSDGQGNWTTPLITANIEIDGNTADGTGSDSIAILTPTSGSFNANQIMTITITSTADVGCIGRGTSVAAGRATGYMLFLASTTLIQFYELADTGSGTSITQIGNNVTVAAVAANDTISFSVHTSGANAVLTAWKNGVQIVEADNPFTDSSGNIWATGKPGILCNGTSPSINAMSADNYTP